jgi:alkylation response protein AidB-like acyl-CoA dehydrogenase
MNFDFSDDTKLLREQARRFLADRCPTTAVRRILEGADTHDRELWRGMAEMGWLGAAVPEAYGGAGLGAEGLCVLAEEIGRAIAPVPFASSVYLATEALLRFATEAQRQAWLPPMVAGTSIGCFALAEGPGNPRPAAVRAEVRGGRLHGEKWPVIDGNIADFAIVVARDATGAIGLYRVALGASGVERMPLKGIDPSRDQARVRFDGAPVEPLGDSDAGWSAVESLLDRAAALLAFEQVGGADACLAMATTYAKERHAFGRPIGSFQAIKHKLADVYIAGELARSNAYFGAWALAHDAPELPLAAATARVAATEAFHLAAKENIQTHGGMGFTWEMDCHLFYRRARLLAVQLGSSPHWKNRLVTLWSGQAAA